MGHEAEVGEDDEPREEGCETVHRCCYQTVSVTENNKVVLALARFIS